MKEIIIKRDGTCITMLEIVDNILRLNIEDHECNYNMDFTLEEIDDLQEAISIMKDKLQRNLSNKKETIEFELPKTMSVSDFESLIGCKTKLSNQKITAIVTTTEQKDEENVSDNEKKLVYGGEIADFPIEIVEKMLEYQVLQGNPRDASVFENKIYASYIQRGFSWDRTKEEDKFWRNVIRHKNFSLFFERYPKKD